MIPMRTVLAVIGFTILLAILCGCSPVTFPIIGKEQTVGGTNTKTDIKNEFHFSGNVSEGTVSAAVREANRNDAIQTQTPSEKAWATWKFRFWLAVIVGLVLTLLGVPVVGWLARGWNAAKQTAAWANERFEDIVKSVENAKAILPDEEHEAFVTELANSQSKETSDAVDALTPAKSKKNV